MEGRRRKGGREILLTIDPSTSTLYSTLHFCATASHLHDACTVDVLRQKSQMSGHTRTW